MGKLKKGRSRWRGSDSQQSRSSRNFERSKCTSGTGLTAVQAARKEEITEQTYYRWRREYGGLKVDQAKRLKDLEKENAQLKKLVADLSLDKQMLQEVARGNF